MVWRTATPRGIIACVVTKLRLSSARAYTQTVYIKAGQTYYVAKKQYRQYRARLVRAVAP